MGGAGRDRSSSRSRGDGTGGRDKIYEFKSLGKGQRRGSEGGGEAAKMQEVARLIVSFLLFLTFLPTD